MMKEEDMDDRRAKPRLSVNLDAVWDGTEGKTCRQNH
jgi:hypothetical protein